MQCPRCGGFAFPESMYFPQESQRDNYIRCLYCGAYQRPKFKPEKLKPSNGRKGKGWVYGRPKLADCPIEDLQNCDPNLLAARYECSAAQVYKVAMARGVKRQFWNAGKESTKMDIG